MYIYIIYIYYIYIYVYIYIYICIYIYIYTILHESKVYLQYKCNEKIMKTFEKFNYQGLSYRKTLIKICKLNFTFFALTQYVSNFFTL